MLPGHARDGGRRIRAFARAQIRSIRPQTRSGEHAARCRWTQSVQFLRYKRGNSWVSRHIPFSQSK